MISISISQKTKWFSMHLILPIIISIFTIFLYITWVFFRLHIYIAEHSDKVYHPMIMEAIYKHLALGEPWHIQYIHFFRRLLGFNLGPSTYYPNLTFTVEEIVLLHLRSDWILPAVLLSLTIASVFMRTRELPKHWGIVFAVIAPLIGYINYIFVRNINAFVWIFIFQFLLIAVILIWNFGPKWIGAFGIFCIGLQIPTFDYCVFKMGVFKILLFSLSPPDYFLFYGTQYCIVVSSVIMTLLIHYLRLVRSARPMAP